MTPDEVNIIDAVDIFSKAMKQKMIQKSSEGYVGWDDEQEIENLQERLREHFAKGLYSKNLVDIANFCMMLWNIQTRKK